MAKYLVNPGKCISIRGVPHKAGSLVEIDASQVKRLLADKTISDPTKPLIATPAQSDLARFKEKPPVKDEPPSGADDAVQSIIS